jgi:hypothetical protein
VPLAYNRQPPTPLQVPSVPQLIAPWSAHWFSGSWPAGTVEQMPPVPVSEHDMHVPVHAVWQHTPWAQIPLAQSAPAMHAAPSGSLPQLPALHTLPAEQSALLVHAARQLPALHVNGTQDSEAPGAHVPMPSQRPPSASVDPLQIWLLQAVPGAYSRHAPAPLQNPSVPQLVMPASAHWFNGSWPAGIGVHTPRVPASAHEAQMPVHGPLQHTPCWHWPDWHSAFAVHSTPFSRLPQIDPLQTLAPLQSALLAHAARHCPFVPHA